MAHLAAALILVHALTRAADRCDSPQTQAAMNVCAAEELHRMDAQLNAVYRKLTATLDANRRRKLQAAQRAWLAFRDAHCEFEASAFEGGSMQPLEYSACATNVTKERIGHLRQALDAPR
jgi:uncharacterized protein YecT (DUF1311 family)